jgi:hypothetical protein
MARSKPIIKPPILDTAMVDLHKRASWQVSLSPSDPIRVHTRTHTNATAPSSPSLPHIDVKCHDLCRQRAYPQKGSYCSNSRATSTADSTIWRTWCNKVCGQSHPEAPHPQVNQPDQFELAGSRGGYFLVPLYSSAGSGEDMHPIFNHVQIIVNAIGRREEGYRVSKVVLVFIPPEELGDRGSSELVDAPSSPPIVFPITMASFMDTASATHKRKLPPADDSGIDEGAPTPEGVERTSNKDEIEESTTEELRRSTRRSEPTSKRRRNQAESGDACEEDNSPPQQL